MSDIRVDAAFRSSRPNECYLFVQDKFVVVNYSPGTMKVDRNRLTEPMRISQGFRMPANTPFENGIKCAFDTYGNEALIFSENHCARIDYAPPHALNARLLTRPTSIVTMFPSLRGTGFENGINAAIRFGNDAYLFKGREYIHIAHNSKGVVSPQQIRVGFRGLYGTVFEDGIDAAFASHEAHKGYIFKGERYARVNFAPADPRDGCIIVGIIRPTLQNWPCLRCLILPCYI